MLDTTQNSGVVIAVRERPFRDELKSTNLPIVTSYPTPNILVVDERPFSFDHVLGPDVTQKALYESIIKPLVAKALAGYNCTALAYGQTGTGKSYTMGLNSDHFEGAHAGVISRCLREIFNNSANEEEEPNENISSSELQQQQREISASFIEIYNEKVYDLLAENSKEPIIAKGYKFTGGTRKTVESLEECHDLLIQGNNKRHVRSTNLNSKSSRSHAIFTIHLRQHRGGEGIVLASSLNIVDLAGSEGVRRTGHQGVAMSEGVNINQGLLSIGKVLQALTMGQKVIPYRDSVLSSVLQDSLNANSYLTLLACISPHREDLSETLSTLRFAQNAKQLKHTPQMNSVLAEIKRNKVKTPRLHTQPTNRSSQPTPTPFKRPYSSIVPTNRSTTAKKAHSSTFCTPASNKRPGQAQTKCNQSEVGLTPKEKEKALMLSRAPVVCSLATAYPYEFGNRSSLFDHTLDSRGSLMSLNISSSTTLGTVPEHVQQPASYSPVVRKCLAELEPRMDTLMQMMSTLINKTQQVSSLETPAREDITCIPNTMRNELKSLMKEVLAEKSSQITPINPGIKCQLFTTSSPNASIHDITDNCNHSAIDHSLDNVAKETSTSDSGLNTSKSQDEQPTMMPKPVWQQPFAPKTELNTSLHSVTAVKQQARRRSTRLLERSRAELNVTSASINESLLQESTAGRRGRRSSSRAPSLKQIHENRRRSVRLAAHLEEPGEDSNASGIASKPIKKRSRKANANLDVSNPIIAGYLGAKGDKKSKSNTTVAHKGNNLTKHREAVLVLLNTGSLRDLQVLPQIGQKTAYQIVTHRTLNGKFKTLNQVQKLPIWRGTSWQRFAQANLLE